MLRLLPFVDEGIDLRGDEFLQDAAGFVVIGGKEHFVPCHSGATRSVEPGISIRLIQLPGSGFALRAPRNDDACHNPICLDARSFMISSVPPPIALTLTSR